MNILKIIKKIIPFVLLISIFLPMSQCTRHPHFFNKLKTPQITVNYVTSGSNYGEIALNILSLAWPFLLLLFFLRVKNLDKKIFIKIIELVLCSITGFLMFLITLFDQILYGGVIVIVSILIYFFITLYELYCIIKARESLINSG